MPSLVLFPYPFLPARSGLSLRALHLARALGREMEVEVAAVANPPAPAVEEPFSLVHLPGDWSRARAYVRAVIEPWPVAQVRSAAMARYAQAGRWDVVQAHTLTMMRYPGLGHPIVLDAADLAIAVTRSMSRIDSRRTMRPLWRFEQIKTRAFEAAAARRAAAVTVPTDHEAAAFADLGARRVVVVPNGVELAALPHRSPAAGAEVVFVGYFAWRPNVEAALELCDEVLPRLRHAVGSATLSLVGDSAPPELGSRAGPAIRLTGAVESVVPHLHRARMTVLPLRAGGGTRIKVLEAMACGVPVIATPFALSGLAGVRHGVNALIGNTSAELGQLAARVAADDELAGALSAGGRELVERHYDWVQVARPLVELHDELAERGPGGPAGTRAGL